MATLREYVLEQSTLPTGNTVRDHILNPAVGGGGGEGGFIYTQEPIQVFDSEILQVSSQEDVNISESVILEQEADGTVIIVDQDNILEVTDGENNCL